MTTRHRFPFGHAHSDVAMELLAPPGSPAVWFDGSDVDGMQNQTLMDGDPVNGQVDFRTLQDGTSHPARTTISMPAKNLRATVENFDYLWQH